MKKRIIPFVLMMCLAVSLGLPDAAAIILTAGTIYPSM